MTDKAKADSPCAKVRSLRERHLGLWTDYHEAMSNEESFLHGDRYQRDSGSHNRDRRRLQIRGQEIQDTVRHVVGKMTERKWQIGAKPVDQEPDPASAEIAVQLIEMEFGNPLKGFKREYYQAVQAACEVRVGLVWADYDADCGPFGEIVYSFEDGRRFMWDPTWHPHHPKNGWLIREKRVHPDEINALYGVDWVQPDRMAFSSDGRLRNDIPLLMGPNGRPVDSHNYDDEKATLWECWYKNDHSKKKKGTTEAPLEPGKRYMQCLEGCGYKTGTEEEMGLEFPDAYPMGCEVCGGDMKRIDAEDVSIYEAAYKNGRKLIIMAPLSPAPNDDPLYQGGWPIPRCRSYPGLFVTRYVKPGAPMGKSDVAVMWDQQVASDNLMTKAVQSVFEHRTYWDMPSVGYMDAKGKRFMFRDDQSNIMFRDMNKNALGPMNVQAHNASGLDPNWGNVYGMVQAALTKHRPQLDIGPAEQSTRNIPVGTIERQVAEAEISTADFQRRVQAEMGIFAGVVWDMICATYTEERINRLNIGGLGDIMLALRGDEQPNYDFTIEDTPEFTGLDKARSEAAQWAIQAITNPATQPFFDILARLQQLPESVIKDIELRMEEVAAQQPMMPPGMPPEGGEDMGGEMPGESVGEALGMEPPIGDEEAMGAELPAF